MGSSPTVRGSTHQVRTTAAQMKLEICATLWLLCLYTVQYGGSIYSAGSRSPGRIGPSIAKQQKVLRFLNSI